MAVAVVVLPHYVRIARAAEDLFAEHGYERVTVADICAASVVDDARRTGCSGKLAGFEDVQRESVVGLVARAVSHRRSGRQAQLGRCRRGH